LILREQNGDSLDRNHCILRCTRRTYRKTERLKFDSVAKNRQPVGNMYKAQTLLEREDTLDGQGDLKSEGWCGFGTRDS